MKHVKTKKTADDQMAEANNFHTPLVYRVARSMNHRKARMAYENYVGMCETYTAVAQAMKEAR